MSQSIAANTHRFQPITAEYSLSESEVGAPIAIMGVPFDNVTRSQTLKIIHRMIESRSSHYVATANVDFLVQAQTDVELRRILFDAHLVLCDGTPLIWASNWLGNPLPERVAGSDLVPLLLDAAATNGYRIFLLGAAEEMNRKAAEHIQANYPKVVVAGRYSPPPAALQDMAHDEIKRQISIANPDILLVAFGCPKQEKWISMHYRELGVPVCVGVGATLDFLAGAVKRAPTWMQRSGLEWVWRLAQEPRRLFSRYMKGLMVFGKGIIRQLWDTRVRKSVAKQDAVQTVPLADDAKIIVMPERLDAAAVRESRAHWETQASDGMVIVDLGETRFIDSTGVGFLMRLRRLAREMNVAFALAAVQPSVWRSIEVMKLNDFFPVGATVDAAWEIANESRQQFQFSRPTANGIALQLQGELTEATVGEAFSNCTAMMVDLKPGKKVTLDLALVTFMDSSGIAVLVRLRKVVRAGGLEFEIRRVSTSVLNTLQTAGLAVHLLNESACKSA